MLVLSRKRDESIILGDIVKVTIVDIKGDRVRIGIEAPKEVSVHRKEVYDAIEKEKERNRLRQQMMDETGQSPIYQKPE